MDGTNRNVITAELTFYPLALLVDNNNHVCWSQNGKGQRTVFI